MQSYAALLDLESYLRKGCKHRDTKKQDLLLFLFFHIKVLRLALGQTTEPKLRSLLQNIFSLLAECDDVS